MSQLRACGVLIFREKPIREFLLLRHPTRWDLPKGHTEKGETDRQCALREMEEETGISASQIELDPEFRFTTQYQVKSKRTGGEWWDKTLVIYLGRLKDEVDLALTEHDDFEWIPWDPPHEIQAETIDPLLAELAEHLARDK